MQPPSCRRKRALNFDSNHQFQIIRRKDFPFRRCVLALERGFPVRLSRT